jgi:cell division protein FtsN
MTNEKRATPVQSSALISSALAVLLERVGGAMTYTQTEYAAVRAARGEYVITAVVDKSRPGEPLIRVALEASSAKGSMPVS